MNLSPTAAEAGEIARSGAYKVLPVSCEILSDFITPIEVVRILKNVSKHCYLLESAQTDETWGRYSFLGYDPTMEITCLEGKIHIRYDDGREEQAEGNPSVFLRKILTLKSYKLYSKPFEP